MMTEVHVVVSITCPTDEVDEARKAVLRDVKEAIEFNSTLVASGNPYMVALPEDFGYGNPG